MPDDGTIQELVRGRIVRMPVPFPYHGLICTRVAMTLANFAEQSSSGTVLINDSGIVTERDPDTVRGADIAYYSRTRLPSGTIQQGRYLDIVPELVVEIRSPSERWQKVLQKTSEYLAAGVSVVVVVDPATNSANVYRDEGSPQTFGPDDTLTIPDVLPGFCVPVRRFFA
jgi:Uma2 family endonuclease